MSTGEDHMWCLIMFDLPVTTPEERNAANSFRRHLRSLGFSRYQLSVYVRYSATAHGHIRQHAAIKNALPHDGTVTILYLRDKQWATATRFLQKTVAKQPPKPDQLTIF